MARRSYRYYAELPGRFQQGFDSLPQAIWALAAAQQRYGGEPGQVVEWEHSGEYHSSTVVYPVSGPTYAVS